MYNKSIGLISVGLLVCSLSLLPGCKKHSKRHVVDLVTTTTIEGTEVIVEHNLPIAPIFELQDENGTWHSLDQYKGQKVALVFYPKDGSPVCTSQVCSLRDNLNSLKNHGITVIGISTDAWQKHKQFKKDNHLNFTLLSDPKSNVSKIYDVRNWLGFSKRQTVLINETGHIAARLHDVNVDTQIQDILNGFGYSK